MPKRTPPSRGDIRYMPHDPVSAHHTQGHPISSIFPAEDVDAQQKHCCAAAMHPRMRQAQGDCTRQNHSSRHPTVALHTGLPELLQTEAPRMSEPRESVGEAKLIWKPPTAETSLLARLRQTWLMCFSLSMIWLITGSGPFTFTSWLPAWAFAPFLVIWGLYLQE